MEPLTAKGIAASGQEAATGKTEEPANPHSAIGDCLREADPLLGWFGLAAGVKQSKLRQMKRGWQRGSVDASLLAVMVITWLIVIAGYGL